MSDKLPPPYDKMSWNELMADLSRELTGSKFKAEGDAIQLQTIFKQQPGQLVTAQSEYTAAAATYNGLSVYLQTLLRSGINPKGPIPDLNEARNLYKTFEDESERLKRSAPHHLALNAHDAGFLPAIGDVVKVFDVILKATEWFKSRHDTQRKQIADLLASTDWRQWDHAGDSASQPEPTPAEKPAEKSATAG